MKKRAWVLGLLLLMLLAATAGARGEIALDLTAECTFTLGGKQAGKGLTDRKFTSYMESQSMKNPALVMESKNPVYGLYLCFQKMPEAYEIQTELDGEWVTVAEGDTRFAHVYYALDGLTKVRVRALGDKKQVMGFNEVYAFGEGNVPNWVQRWEETPEKADVLFVITHPGEELLYLGGAIPYYAREKEASTAVACFSYANTTRRSELLNGLWSMGYRHYPILGNFNTAKTKDAKSAYKNAGEEAVLSWLTGVYRQVRPEVVVGPDLQGEGKNGQRMMLADACVRCVDLAADAAQYPNAEGDTEGWLVRKLYLHLYAGESQIEFDWTQPMVKLGNKAGRELAYYAYLYHKTQDDQDATVFGTGAEYDYGRFGLVSSIVGEDTACDDFLENIPAEELTGSVIPEEAPEWTVDEIPGYPELTEAGFLPEGEFIWSDDAHGHYVYISATLNLTITRKMDGSLPLTWFETDIRCDLTAGEKMINMEYTPEKAVGKKSRVDAALNATANKMVFAANGDYYTYRVGSKNGKPIGVEIRDGKIYYDDRYDYVEEKFFPNLDTLAFYEDGSVDVHHSVELSAQDYLNEGAYMVFSFGPYLIRDGELSEWVLDATKSKAKNPRHSFGMIEPGHYVDIMCEGRLGSRSEGVTMPQLAMLSKFAGCTEACDLDGGQTAVVIFMGKQLNQIGKYDGKTSARETCEVMGIGISDQVGVYEVR